MTTNDDHEPVISSGGLQTRLFTPLNSTTPTRLAIFTHPWAPLGGNMHDPVLRTLRTVFLSRGFHVLIYNSRFSFNGLSEAEDLKQLVQSALTTLKGQVEHLVLMGYSHGSLIASMHPILPTPIKTYHILLSYPLSVRSFITFFRGATYETGLKTLVQNPESKVLSLYGDHDQFTSLQNYERWATQLKSDASGRLNVVKIDNGDHFWAQSQSSQMLCIEIGKWLDDVVRNE